MKRILQLSITIALFTIVSIPTFGQAGTINYSQYCYNTSYHAEWVIDVKELKAVRFTYTTDVVYGPPMISIYELSTDGVTYNNISSISGYTTGTVCTNAKTGKAKVIFNAWAIGNAVFTIQYSADNSIVTNNDLHVGGNATVTGSLSAGNTNLSGCLNVNSNANNGFINLNTTVGNPEIKSNAGLFLTSSSTNVDFFGAGSSVALGQVNKSTGIGSMNIVNGSVGIGINNPQYKLDVSGNIHVSDGLYINGSNNEIGGALHLLNNSKTGYGQASNWSIYNMTGGYGNSLQFWAYDAHTTCNNDGLCNNRFTLMDDGNVGIGTTTPSEKLEIFNSNTTPGTLSLQSSRNDAENVDVGRICAKQATTEVARIGMQRVNGTYTGAFTFWTKADNNSSLTEKVRIAGNGKVSIGTTVEDLTDKVLLTVNGTIHTKEVLIDLTAPLADYVFDSSYQLMPLSQVKQYVKENNHLPEMPSAKEVNKNGLSIGEMQNKLLQKVEELTLYSIQQQEEIQLLKSEIQQLKQK